MTDPHREAFEQPTQVTLFGDDGGGEPRVPIPNTTVKPSSADGTWTAGSWESRTLPSRMNSRVGDSPFLLFPKKHL
jgi:hypothetical protein